MRSLKATLRRLSTKLPQWRGSRRRLPQVKHPGLVVIALGVIALGFATSALLLWRSDSNHDDETAARSQALAAARENVPRLYTYQYDTVDEQLDDVVAELAEPYREEFSITARTRLAPIAKELRIKVAASVVEASVVSADSDEVVALMFLNQQTALPASPDPLNNGYSLRVTMTKHGDDWLISELTVL